MKIQQKKWTAANGWQDVMGDQLAEQAQLVFLFGGVSALKDQEQYNAVKNWYPHAQVVSVSTAGEIIGTQVLDESLVVTAIAFEKTQIQAVQAKIWNMDESLSVGHQLGEALPKEGLIHVLVFSDGLHMNGTMLVNGLAEKLPPEVSVTGGLAGDQDRFQETLVGLNYAPQQNVVIAIGLYGNNIKVGYGSMGGWDPFGPERLVTKSKANVLYELDGQLALDLYKKYLGEQAKNLPASGLLFPLSLRIGDREVGIVRTILAVNDEEGSMTFAGDIPEGSYARLMKANFERLVDGAQGAASMSTQSLQGTRSELALLISCVGRKLVLKQRVEEEVEGVASILGEQTVITGFYSYGEICPVAPTEKQCDLHNQTMTITTLTEQ
ncbi:MAG: FIST N-terminal domain-containing protein [Patescibacteria group bacterium]